MDPHGRSGAAGATQEAAKGPMKILVIGSGGREHALCWKLAASKRRPTLYCAPGNGGTASIACNVGMEPEDIDGLVGFAQAERIDLTVVGPEDPLCAGLVDRLNAAGLRAFGPTAAAARLEGDKSYAKQLMREVGVPTADARVFGPTQQELAQIRQPGAGRDEPLPAEVRTGYEMARDYVATRDDGVVVKACGLARGKGVFVHPDPSAALGTLERLMVHHELGPAGERVLIEDLLLGTEVSVMALVDGKTIYVLESATDYKRIGENDTGLNTGGMGAFSPSPHLQDADLTMIERDILVPIVDALRRIDVSYKGVLYAGIMLTAGGPKVLEFNCRFGDPETQPVLMRLKSDLVEVIEATIDGRLDEIELAWDERSAVCVVMASRGYPGPYEKGRVITGLEDAAAMADVAVFHAGTQRSGGDNVTSGGRVLGVTALGETLQASRNRAYEATRLIQFDGAYLRGDIGMRVSAR